MKKSRWSPTDLDRQRLVVRRLALRSEIDLRALAAARARMAAALRQQLGMPVLLASCFVAGAIAVPHAPAHRDEAGTQAVREAGTQADRKEGAMQRSAGRLRRVTSLLRSITLAASALSALSRGSAL